MAKKAIHLHSLANPKDLSDAITELALDQHKDSGQAVLAFARTVNDVEKIADKLRKAKQQVETLTGTLRGLERDGLMKKPILQRFLPDSNKAKDVLPTDGTVYLICTSAGEVGIDISADHLICDLTPFDSMVQRFGRVNRFGDCNDTRIDIIHPVGFDTKKEFDRCRNWTLELLKKLNGDGSAKALGELPASDRLAAFSPKPVIPSATDVLFDAWALTTIRKKLPGRPLVEPYLHGIRDWEPPETRVGWREEVDVITGDMLKHYEPDKLLDDYPLKSHEVLRDVSGRVFDRLTKLKVPHETSLWIVSDDGSVEVSSLGELIESGKDAIEYKTVLLPPQAGGLMNGMLTAGFALADDVSDEWRDDKGTQWRCRVWDDDEHLEEKTKGMWLVRQIKFQADEEDEDSAGRSWLWFGRAGSADNADTKSTEKPVLWQHHTDDVTINATRIVKALDLPDGLQEAITLAAKFHDLGKKRELWQRSIGNPNPTNWHAKSGRGWKPHDITNYRHEFGSLLDIHNEPEFRSARDKDLILHLVAAHHGWARPHFEIDAYDPPPTTTATNEEMAIEVMRRFGRLQQRFGRWGLAYLESLLRAADYAASARPSTPLEAEV